MVDKVWAGVGDSNSGGMMIRSLPLVVVVAGFSCSQVLGFKDPSLARDDDARVPDDSAGNDALDASSDASDARDNVPDAGVTALWAFTTSSQFLGDFGLASGARIAADTKCDDMYQSTYTTRSCSHVHAVLQVDSTVDTLGRMAATFAIPTTAGVFRASDGTQISNSWAELINPNAVLLAAVSGSTSSVIVWSGRGISVDESCNSWRSRDGTLSGDTGDAIARQNWLSRSKFSCNNLTPHLLCVCW